MEGCVHIDYFVGVYHGHSRTNIVVLEKSKLVVDCTRPSQARKINYYFLLHAMRRFSVRYILGFFMVNNVSIMKLYEL